MSSVLTQQTPKTQPWRGIIDEYRDRLPVSDATPVISLREGGTPLVRANVVSERTGCEVWLKVEGANPTGSFKDRGMTMAISKAAEDGARAVICASTGNTSASAAAYAVRAGMVCAVLVPQGKIALGKLSQALAHGARLLQVDGNFDDCLTLARELSEQYPVALVNSVNPVRIEGQKTAAFEIVDQLGDAPDIHALPVGNAGNITAYWRGYREYADDGVSSRRPRMWGFQAAGAAPIVRGEIVPKPSTVATAIRIGNPASWQFAIEARDDSGGLIDAVTDREILSAYRLLAAQEGVFVEPASASGVAGLLKKAEAGVLDEGQTVVCTVTGHGLKDPDWAIAGAPQPVTVEADPHAAADSARTDAVVAAPMFRAATLRVRVPATSANLGPGYDSFGLALSLYDEIVVRVGEDGLDLDVAGEGADKVRKDSRNLVIKAMNTAFDRMGGRPRGLEVRCLNRIPHGRGLGSSSAAIVGGLAAARALTVGGDDRLDDERLLAVATEMEGHPDNVAATVHGGFTMAWTDGGEVGVLRAFPHPDLLPVAFIPGTEVRTTKARKALPDVVPHGDAALNSARAALLGRAITDRPDLLMVATEDFLHQEYRRPVMPRTLALVDELRAAGVPAVVSGAGPTVLALTDRATASDLAAQSRRGWRIEAIEADRAGCPDPAALTDIALRSRTGGVQVGGRHADSRCGPPGTPGCCEVLRWHHTGYPECLPHLRF